MKLGRDRSQQICKKRRRTLFQALIGGFASGEKAAQMEGKGEETATEGKDVLITEFLISERRTNERRGCRFMLEIKKKMTTSTEEEEMG